MKKVFFILTAMFMTISVFSQSKQNLPDKKVYYGLSMGFVVPAIKLKQELPEGYRLYNNSGFNIGIYSQINISKYFSLTPRFEATFTDGRIESYREDGKKVLYRISPLSLDFMAHAVFRMGKKKFNPYFLIGPNYKKALKGPDKELEKWTEKSSFAVDVGLGTELYFKRFIIAPELRYSYSFTNISSLQNIESIKMNTISLVFVFKG